MSEKILTLHPQGKSGVNISKAKYDVVKTEIIDALQDNELTFTELSNQIENKLNGKFEGSIGWYVVCVKLDLEARGIVERIPKTRPEKLRLTG